MPGDSLKMSKLLRFLLPLLVVMLTEAEDTYQEDDLVSIYRQNLQRMVNYMDKATVPCADFFQHACGNFEKIAEQYVPPYLSDRNDRMQFFMENKEYFGTRPGELLRDLYDDCKVRSSYDVMRGEPESHWRLMLQEISFLAEHRSWFQEWPFLHHQWVRINRHIEPNWVLLAAKFAAHGIPSILHIFFAEQTIFIAPPELDLECPDLPQIRSSLQDLDGTRNPQINAVISSELWTFCRQLTGQLEFSAEILEVGNDTAQVLVDENMVNYLAGFFSILNFTESDVEAARKIPIDAERLNGILSLVRTTQPRIIFNFVLWHAYERLKYEDCYLLTEEFEQLLLAEYWAWHVFEPHFSKNVAMASYLLHTTRFQKFRKTTLLGKNWDNFLYAKMQQRDFNMERVIRKYAQTFLDTAKLTSFYDVASLKNHSFYHNLMSLRLLKLRNAFVTPLEDTEDVNRPGYFLHNFLNFCISALKQPLFHFFATQGFALWHNSKLLYSSDGYYTALDCLERQTLAQQEDETDNFRALAEDEVRDIFDFYTAFVEALRDYRFWLEGESFAFAEDFVLQYFNLNSSRVLFYAVAQLFCGRNDVQFRAQINRSYMNMPDFQEAFNCSSDALMNPSAKCMIRKC